MPNLPTDAPVSLYGSGFFGFPVNGRGRRENYDRDVAYLYQRLVDADHIDDWKYEKLVLDAYYRLMHPFSGWVEMNSHNPNLNFASLEFIRDTLKFINIGRRDTNVFVAAQLINNWRDRTELSSHQRMESSGKLLSHIQYDDATMVRLWLSHEGGLRDIICTLNAVFGKPFAAEFKGF